MTVRRPPEVAVGRPKLGVPDLSESRVVGVIHHSLIKVVCNLQRPDMNLGIVLDAAEPAQETRERRLGLVNAQFALADALVQPARRLEAEQRRCQNGSPAPNQVIPKGQGFLGLLLIKYPLDGDARINDGRISQI